MYGRISVLVPTRGRVERLSRLLESYDRTTQFVEQCSELVFRIDEDDPDTYQYLADTKHRYLVGPRLQGYNSLPQFFNEMVPAASGDVLMCGNDDMVFKTSGWAPLILTEACRYPDGVFNLGVTTHNETHYPFSIVSRKAVEAMGYIWDPSIFWGDIFLRDTMAHFGRTAMIPHVEIDHDWVGHNPDQVFLEGCNAQDITQRDPTYWTGTHAAAVHNAVTKLQELVR